MAPKETMLQELIDFHPLIWILLQQLLDEISDFI